MIKIDYLILGAGISGLAAGQKLKELGKEYLILEKNNSFGGLCDNFEIDGFRFDRFVHFSFTNDNVVRKFFDQTDQYTHIPNPSNYYHGIWIKHPAQNNLFPLSQEEKDKILTDMYEREKYKIHYQKNYENWLRYQFGDYFAEHFPMVYTKKYWGVEAKELETKWIGTRVYQPTMDEIIQGMNTADTPLTYYAKEMRYPKKGGFKSFLTAFSNGKNIIYNEKVIKIDTIRKIVYTENNEYQYNQLISSLPLPEYEKLLTIVDKNILNAIHKLHWTSAYIVSLGFKGELKKNDLWDYIYDENIFAARIYSPSGKSPDNCPVNCSSIQAEIYFKNDEIPKANRYDILQDTINQLTKANIIDNDYLLIKDIRFEQYANVIFDSNIYSSRESIKNYLNKLGIITIGRFGEWDYLWTDQSFLSGYLIEGDIK